MTLRRLVSCFTLSLLSCLILPASTFAKQSGQEKENDAVELFHTLRGLKKNWVCPEDLYTQAKANLRDAFLADQSDRKAGTADLMEVDRERRQRVAEIGAQGCLHDAEDYFWAALIFQHGQRSEHYLTAIIYARKSYDLGQEYSLSLYEAAIDRYLMSLGRKQLFATQIASPLFYKMSEGKPEDEIPCLWPVDETFDLRTHYRLGGESYLAAREKEMTAQKLGLSQCDFPASNSLDQLDSLLKLKI